MKHQFPDNNLLKEPLRQLGRDLRTEQTGQDNQAYGSLIQFIDTIGVCDLQKELLKNYFQPKYEDNLDYSSITIDFSTKRDAVYNALFGKDYNTYTRLDIDKKIEVFFEENNLKEHIKRKAAFYQKQKKIYKIGFHYLVLEKIKKQWLGYLASAIFSLYGIISAYYGSFKEPYEKFIQYFFSDQKIGTRKDIQYFFSNQKTDTYKELTNKTH